MGWLAGWTYRVELTLDNTNVDSDLSDFPVLVKLGTSVGQGSDDVSAIFDELTSDANRKKIAITTSNGYTQCYVEIQSWDDASEEAYLWVRVPTLATASTTTLYLYYDSTQNNNTTYVGDTGDAAAQSVWDSNFIGVWHLEQDPNGDPADEILDSTSNGYDGTPTGSMTTADLVAGLIGKAIEFDGSNDRIDTGCPGVGGSNDRTIEASFWAANGASGSGSKGFIFWGWATLGTDGTKFVVTTHTDGKLRVEVDNGYAYATTNLEDSTWHNIAVVCDSITDVVDVDTYVDGAVDAVTSSSSQTINTGTDYDVSFGAQYQTDASWWEYPCKLDEIRISNIARSADWIKATHYSNQDDIVTFGDFESGWLAGWQKRIKLTIDDTNVDSDLTDFPVLVYLSTSSGIGTDDVSAVFDELGEEDLKIAVTEDDGLTETYVEVEKWDGSGEEAWLWVLVPSILASGGATLYLYYDANHADNTTYIGVTGSAVAQNVWDSNFDAVYHLEQDPSGGSGCILDSTSNGRDGTPSGSMTSGDLVSSLIGNGIDFDGSDDFISIGTPGLDTGWTLEVIAETDDNTANQEAISNDNSGWNDDVLFGCDPEDPYTTGLRIAIVHQDAGTSTRTILEYTTNISNSTYYHSAVTADTTLSLYVDGTLRDSEATHPAGGGNSWEFGQQNTNIGATNQSAARRPWDGIVCEVRLSTTARSAAWIKATYYSSTDALITFGSEEAINWLGEWANRIKITLAPDNVDADLTDFPVLVYLSTSSGTGNADVSAVFDELGASSLKLAITGVDGYTQQYVEIDKWDNTGEEAWLWTKVPTYDDTVDTILYLYYDSGQDNNTDYVGVVGSTPGQNVWDSNFVLVAHLGEDPDSDPAGGILDSTSNGNDLDVHGSMTSGDLVDTYPPGDGIDFDGSNDYLQRTAISEINAADHTFEVLWNLTNHSSGRTPFHQGDQNQSGNQGWAYTVNGSGYMICSYFNGGWRSATSDSTVSTGSLQYLVWGYDHSEPEMSFWQDANKDAIETMTHVIVSTTYPLHLMGLKSTSMLNFVLGGVTEVRISDKLREDEWIKATYYTLNDGLAAFGSEENNPWVSTETVELTDPLECTFNFVTGVAITQGVPLATPLSFNTELIASKVTFFENLAQPLSVTLGLDASALATKLVGRDLWEFNSYITKILERDSTITKTVAKQSRITRNFDDDSSVR